MKKLKFMQKTVQSNISSLLKAYYVIYQNKTTCVYRHKFDNVVDYKQSLPLTRFLEIIFLIFLIEYPERKKNHLEI